MKKLFVLTTLTLLFSLFSLALAADKVVVIPLNSKQPVYVAGEEITSLPYIINSAGFYYLSSNLFYDGTSNAITVNADEVTIDLMGYGLVSTQPTGVRSGVYMQGRKNVEIRNGTISDFFFGIFEDDYTNTNAFGHYISNIRGVRNSVAIHLGGTSHIVTHCIATNSGSDGIYVNEGIVSECTAQGGGNRGIDMNSGLIKNCYSVSNRIGIQIISGAVIGNVAISNTDYGFLLGSSPSKPVLMDQNSASGNTHNYSGGTPTMGTNAGF